MPASGQSNAAAHAVPELGKLSDTKNLRRQRRTLILFFGAFLLPVAAAYFLLATGWWADTGSVNNGRLLSPPITLPATVHEALLGPAEASKPRKPWIVLSAIEDTCNASCKNALMLTRQTKTLLGSDRHRVQLTLLHTEALTTETQALIDELFPHLRLVEPTERMPSAPAPLARNAWSDLLLALSSRTALLGSDSTSTSQLLIIDPLGNGMLLHNVPSDEYQSILEGKGFLKDLKRLLKYSRIG